MLKTTKIDKKHNKLLRLLETKVYLCIENQ